MRSGSWLVETLIAMTAPLSLSADCLGWARTAGYECSCDAAGDTLMLSSDLGTRLYVRVRARGRLELSQSVDGEDPCPVLYASSLEVLERHLYGVMGDEIRDEVCLPHLELPWAKESLARGYMVSDMQRGYRILSRDGRGAVAAAPDPVFSLVTLVPLSHLLGLDAEEIRRSYLAEDGAPLLAEGDYADR